MSFIEMEQTISCQQLEIEDLRETITAQAAVIESLKSALIKFGLHKLSCDYVEQHRGGRFEGSDGVCDCGFSDALAIPTDSTQILDEVRRAERERCAELCEKSDRYRGDYFAAKIRGME